MLNKSYTHIHVHKYIYVKTWMDVCNFYNFIAINCKITNYKYMAYWIFK